MKNLKSYSKFLSVFCKFIVIPAVIFSFVGGWFRGDESWNEIFAGFGYSWDAMDSLTNIPTVSKFLGMIVDGLAYLLLFVGIFYFLKLLKSFQEGDRFSLKTLQLFKRICKVALAWVIYTPIKRMLLSIITTFFNPVGQRVIKITINSGDIFNIFFVSFLFVLASLMKDAYELKSDQDLTI